jgi:anti-anti-sigma factor
MTVAVHGELDIAVGQELQLALGSALARSVRGVDLDLSGVGFCDCAGLKILLGIRRRARDQSKTVTVRHASRAVRRIAWLTGTRLFSAEEIAYQGPDLRIEVWRGSW